MSGELVGLACLGTGYISAIHVQRALQIGGVQVRAVWSRSEQRGRTFADKFSIPRVYTDFERLLDDPEVNAVIIGLPTPLHREFTVRAAMAGKHILCEKPIALTLADGEEMIRIAEASGVVLMIAHVLRFWPEYVAAKEIVESGRLGKMRSILTYRLSGMPQWSSGNWLLDPTLSGGVPVDLHIHDLDFILWLLGEPLAVVAAGTSDPSGLINDVVSLLEFKDALASAEAGYILPRGEKFRAGFRVVCDQGLLEFNNLSKPTLTLIQNGEARGAPMLPATDAYAAQLEYFVECVRTKHQPNLCPPPDSLKALELSLRVKQMIEQRRLP